jgi:GNAT acetyltransferase-like protein
VRRVATSVGRAGQRQPALKGESVGLDAVLTQESAYTRAGFVSSHRNVRWRVAGGALRPDNVIDLRLVPFGQLAAYDATVFGTERGRFLRAWIDRPPGHALACLRDGGLAGYGVLRTCRAGAKVGPLLADDEEAADAVLNGLLAAAGPDTDVFIDMPGANPHAHHVRAGRAMDPVFETARMYRNGTPPEDTNRVYGVTTLEFG